MFGSGVKNGRIPVSRREWFMIAGTFAASIVAGVLAQLQVNAVLVFVVSGVALAFGRGTDHNQH